MLPAQNLELVPVTAASKNSGEDSYGGLGRGGVIGLVVGGFFAVLLLLVTAALFFQSRETSLIGQEAFSYSTTGDRFFCFALLLYVYCTCYLD